MKECSPSPEIDCIHLVVEKYLVRLWMFVDLLSAEKQWEYLEVLEWLR